jgi:hypothetical protein
MMEYAGIDTPRLEAMEERLKKDVLSEVRAALSLVPVLVTSNRTGFPSELIWV